MSSNPDPTDSNEIVLEAKGVSKRFQLGQFIGPAATLRTLKLILSNPIKYFLSIGKKDFSKERISTEGGGRYLWALRDIDITVRRGERVAILGRNGAGKSTLLKILVGIMAPTEGAITKKHRLVPLMGVGAGFNLELSGRENIFMNGVVLGLSPTEIKDRMAAIIEFSEIPDFMDTPVKRYSKGMRARLGMAIAVSIDPDILVVDEVLAVGDIKFRAKCMEKIGELCDKGMTLLFVSHSPARVKVLCERAILIRDGLLIGDGPIAPILKRYLDEDIGSSTMEDGDADDVNLGVSNAIEHNYLPMVEWDAEAAPGDDLVRFLRVSVGDIEGKENQNFDIRKDIVLEMVYEVLEDSAPLRPQFQVFDHKLETVFVTVDSSDEWRTEERVAGVYSSKAVIPGNLLSPETYIVGASVYTHFPLDKHARTGEIVSFTIQDVSAFDTAQSDYPRPLPGRVRPLLKWHTEMVQGDAALLEATPFRGAVEEDAGAK